MSSYPPAQLVPEQINYALTAQWKSILRQALLDLRVAIPAIVQSFDQATQTVAVQIAISEFVKKTAGPAWTAIPPIYKVPICVPRAGGFCMTLPIQAGDEGLLIFTDTMFDLWWVNGQVQPPPGAPPVQPNHERRRHDVTDCIFIPGIWNQKRLVSNYSSNSAQLRSDDDTVIVDLAPAGITLTAPKVVMNTTGDVDINANGNVNINGQQIVAASSGSNTKVDGKVFLTHQHTGVQTGAGDTGPVL